MVIELIFMVSVAMIVYTYVGYPIFAFLLSHLYPRPVRQARIEPEVSVIIAAYNEEACIAEKLENTLALDYPREKLEIIVASDCSVDGTDEIVRSFAPRGVILHRQSKRLGKTVAQNEAMKISSGEILVFSDATSVYEPAALRKLLRSFADPQVGCVTGQLIYADPAATAVGSGCRSYWSYEKILRQCESRLGSLVGVSGCMYAVRRTSYARMGQDMSSDFVIASEIRQQGLRTVYDPEAISIEYTNKKGRDEFRMRVRIIEQTMSAMHAYGKLLDPRQYGMFAFQMISHKIMRYAVPLFLLLMLLSNSLLASESEIYLAVFIAQIAFYFAALVGWICDRAGLRFGLAGLPYYFVLANAASLIAFVKFMRGEAHVVWDPVRESEPSDENPASRAATEAL